jgi:hypothetical protein
VGDVLSTPAKDHIDQLLTATGSSSELNNVTSIHWVSSKFLAVGFEDSCIKVIDTSTQQTISKLNCNLVPLNSYFMKITANVFQPSTVLGTCFRALVGTTSSSTTTSEKRIKVVNNSPFISFLDIVSIFDSHS